MSELAAVAMMLRCIGELVEGTGILGRKMREIRGNELLHPGEGLHEAVPRTEVFTGLSGTRGAGVAASLTARRADQRQVLWIVEVWIDTWEGEGVASAIVKGEIEVADESGVPQTLFDWQRNVRDVPAVVDAVRECADLVATYDVR